MARTTHDTCRSIMIDLQGRGFEQEASRRDILDSVSRIAGETRATRDRYMNSLKKYGFVTQTAAAAYTLHFDRIDGDGEASMIGELTRRMSRLEAAVAKLRKNQEAEYDG